MSITMKKIMLTGCNGQLGRAMNQALLGFSDYEIINTDVGELDITKIEAVTNFVKEVRPEIIVNCAAYTAVDKAESDYDLAYRINAIGPRNLSIAATEAKAKLVHISTDYVFDGNATKPYVEFDTPNPQGAYGKTKLEGERFVTQFADRFFIFRTAWLYGDGHNFVKTMLRLSESNDSVRVVCDQKGSPTSAFELAGAIVSQMFSDNYGLFHATCEGDTNWAEFAEEIFRLAGKSTQVIPITSSEYQAAAPRPSYSILDNYMLRLTSDYRFKDWHDALAKYIGEM